MPEPAGYSASGEKLRLFRPKQTSQAGVRPVNSSHIPVLALPLIKAQNSTIESHTVTYLEKHGCLLTVSMEFRVS